MKRNNNFGLDLRHPFFVPVWRRILCVVLLFIWGILETLGGNTFWALLVFGIGAYSVYCFFFDFVLPEDDAPDDSAPR